MLTLFSIPKPFKGHIAVMQRNAIGSWRRLHPDCEVILCGDEEGTREAALEFGVQCLPDVVRNEYGTPLLSSVFGRVNRIARHSLLCYVNADIILMSDLLAVIRSVPFQRFLVVGQRWDLCVDRPLEFEAMDWEGRLKEEVRCSGSLHPSTGIDYFVYPRGVIEEMPRFAVGRPGWDNWLIYRTRYLGIPVIDVSGVNTVVHQNHDYGHVKFSSDGTTEGPEAIENRKLAGGWRHLFTIEDSTHRLSSSGVAFFNASLALRKNYRTLPFWALVIWKQLSHVGRTALRVSKRRLLARRIEG